MVGLATDFLVQIDKPKHLSDGSQPSQNTDGTVITQAFVMVQRRGRLFSTFVLPVTHGTNFRSPG